MLIGLIGDTHGLLRSEALAAFDGVELILHSGDVGGRRILDALEMIAPVQAVWGNTDSPGDSRLVERLDLVLGGLRVHVSHGHELGRPKPAQLAAAYDADVIIYGHTHIPIVETVESRLVINPGAAGPRRFDITPSVALLTIQSGSAAARLVPLPANPED